MEAAEESVGWGKLDMGSAEPREPEPEPEPQPPAGLPGEPEPEPEEGVPPEEVGYWEAEGIPGVVLYDEHTRSRQKGRLQITRSQLSFYPASGGGRPVSFPLESVQSAKRAEKGGRFKVEARVLVPRQDKSAAIAFEFDDRRRERDDALRAMSKEDGLFGRQSLFDGAEIAAAAAAQTGEIRVGAVLRDSRRANRPEQVQLTLGTDKITFEPASGGETATLTLAQLRRIKSSEADSGLFATLNLINESKFTPVLNSLIGAFDPPIATHVGILPVAKTPPSEKDMPCANASPRESRERAGREQLSACCSG